MLKRTTIEIDADLLARAKRSLGCTTTRATIEEALRRVALAQERVLDERSRRQRAYFDRLSALIHPDINPGEQLRR